MSSTRPTSQTDQRQPTIPWQQHSSEQEGKTRDQKQAPCEVIAQRFVDDSIWFTGSAAAAQEMARRCELFCDFHSVIINREKSEYLSMNDQGHTLRWTPTNTHPLGKEMHRRGTHGATKRNRGPDGRTIKYLGVHFDAGAGWATQRRKLQEKHGELTAALKHATITVREATYCINNKIIPSIAYPLQVAAVPRSVLERWDKTHRHSNSHK